MFSPVSKHVFEADQSFSKHLQTFIKYLTKQKCCILSELYNDSERIFVFYLWEISFCVFLMLGYSAKYTYTNIHRTYI